MLFLSFILGFIAWIWWGSVGSWRSVVLLLVIPLWIFLFLRGKNWLFIILAILWILMWGYRSIIDYSTHIQDWERLSTITGNGYNKVSVIWSVSEMAYSQDLRAVYRLKIDNIANVSTLKNEGKSEDLSHENIAIFVEIPNNLTVKRWDILSFTGKISPTISLPLEGFERYAFVHESYGRAFLPTFGRIPNEEVSLFEKLHDWSQKIIFQWFPRDIAWILLGMMIGSIELLSSDIKNTFILSWTSHILVVSGSNIAFVILMITGILKYFSIGKIWRIVSVVLFILLYSTLVWWDTSVIRATSMGIITFFAIEHGKRTSSIAILFCIAFILLLVKPLAFAYDAGFWLSFAATIGILLYYKSFQKLLQKGHIPRFFIPILGVTLSASLWSIPVMIYHFWAISTGSLFANILIVWVLGWIMLTGVIYLILGVVGWYILYLFGFLVYIPAQYILLVSHFFALGWTIVIPDSWQTPLCIWILWYLLVEVFTFEEERIITLSQTMPKPQQKLVLEDLDL